MSLREIVNVVITRQTTALPRESFGIPMIAGPNANFTERLRYYTDLSSVADDVHGGTSAPEYLAASDVFSQNPRVSRLAIGHILGNVVITDDAGTYTAGNIIVNVNGTDVNEPFDTDKDTTLTNLATSIQALSDVSTAVYAAGPHTITITPVAGTLLAVTTDLTGITGTMTMTTSATATESITDALNNINDEQSNWYGFVITSRTQSDQLEAAAWAETQTKIFSVASAEADIIGVSDASDTTSLAAQLKAAGYDRTFGIYNADVTNDYADAAYLGRILPYDPGTYTAMFKRLAGITIDDLTPTQSTNARDKNFNVYEEIGDASIAREGVVSSGEFIDVIIFIDWLAAEITTNVYSALVNNLKVPYTDAGITLIENGVIQALQVGQNRGGISPHAFDSDDLRIGGFSTSVPALENVSSVDKANRTLNDVTFVAYLAGAIHAVQINGIVTV